MRLKRIRLDEFRGFASRLVGVFGEVVDVGIRPLRPHWNAVDNEFDREFSREIGGIDQKAGEGGGSTRCLFHCSRMSLRPCWPIFVTAGQFRPRKRCFLPCVGSLGRWA